MEKLDLDKLREEVDDRVYQDADNACIYYADCMDIIRDYEREFDSDADDMGKTYKPSEWEEAAVAYALGIATNAIRHYADKALDQVEEAADYLREELPEAVDLEDLRISTQCPHGWAAHDGESSAGVLKWISRQLDGCNAVAIDAGPFWLSYTWTPAPETE